MPPTPEPPHLSGHHRTTLRELFQHPVSHNIEWNAAVSLLEAVGTVTRHRDGKLAVTVGSQAEFIEPPSGKNIDDEQTVLDLRRMLSTGGYGG